MSQYWKEQLIDVDKIFECSKCSAKVVRLDTKNNISYEAEIYHNEKGLIVVEINGRAKKHNCYNEQNY